MKPLLLDILRCPFCGTRLTLVDNDALVQRAETIDSGVLGCECSAFPIVAGIPVMIADDTTRSAMHAMEAGRRDEALLTLLGLEGARARAFTELLSREDELTYGAAIAVLSPDAEGTYFVYRFSDPTYVMAETVLEGVTQNEWTVAGRVLDMCGGSGHLTRVLERLSPGGGSVLADVFFWKLWLAKQFTAPSCVPICCDANNPLPFARDSFSMVVLSDAFPYIWHKRLLADEMMRVAGHSGTIVMPHLHSALGENVSAGMPLTPAAYRDLFAPMQPRLFSDQSLLDAAIARGAVDLSSDVSSDGLAGQPSLTLIASTRRQVFRRYEPLDVPPLAGNLKVNPLYRVRRAAGSLDLSLSFPTTEYEEEFADSKRYLADTITLPESLNPETLGNDYERLRRRRIVLDVPHRYL
jgi:uncharacterized protein YbaR (Trm112 family)/SAM-dependent methyltransferase